MRTVSLITWSKQLKSPGATRSAVTTDADGAVYLASSDGGYVIDNQQINGKSNVVKLDKNGIFKYGKSYNSWCRSR